MFGHKKNTIETAGNDVAAKVNEDMVVRNMPNLAKIRTAVIRPATERTMPGSHPLSQINAPKQNFKIVGLLIIGGGLLFIGGLVYLSYIYIIKPQTKVPVAVVNTPAPTPSVLVATTTQPVVEVNVTPTPVATVTPELLQVSSSSEAIMPEESGGKSGVGLAPLVDTDFDGLNDEEEAVLGTNPELVDSNNNTYSDLLEIENNYNPAGTGRLSENANLQIYTNKAGSYSILTPKDWPFNSLNNDATVTFSAPDDSIIQISLEDNADGQSIMAWYNNLFPDTTITYDKLKSTDAWDGIWSDDNANFYLTDKKKSKIYILSYIPSVAGRIAYPNIFALMINSFTLK
ncbi:MAG: thrombospondin type 3 repeat-containing protein [Patescibacteria group bacterium]